jgi:hypothetical protein
VEIDSNVVLEKKRIRRKAKSERPWDSELFAIFVIDTPQLAKAVPIVNQLASVMVTAMVIYVLLVETCLAQESPGLCPYDPCVQLERLT